jgi:hypothetical protein
LQGAAISSSASRTEHPPVPRSASGTSPS